MISFQGTEQLSHQLLLGYAYLKHSDYNNVKSLLDNACEMVMGQQAGLIDQASWLWLYGEYVQKSKDRSELLQHESLITLIINNITSQWTSDDVHWIKPNEQDRAIFLSQTALYFAALRSASFLRVSELALMTMKQMRDYLFANFMDGISMVNKQGSQDVSPDMVLATVPFGYFTPGDLALMKALERIDEDSLVGEEAAWFSWYYSECGNLVRARLLLQQAQQTLAINNTWLQAATLILSVHEYEQAIVFDHLPKGYESPYFAGLNERYPRNPLIDDEVTIQVIVRGKEAVASVQLHYQFAGEPVHELEMCKVEEAKAEVYYTAKIPAFHKLGTISYSFSAVSEAKRIYSSQKYLYDTLKWTPLTLVGSIISNAERSLYYQSNNPQFYGLVTTKGHHACSSTHHTFTPLSKEQYIEKTVNMNKENENSLLNKPALHVLLDQQANVHKLKLSYEINKDVHWYGMGERFAQLSYQHCELDNYVFNQYKDQGLRTYIPVPIAIGSQHFGIFLESGLYSKFKFGSNQQHLLEIEAELLLAEPILRWHVLAGTPKQQLNQYIHIVGKPKLPPKWAFGPWMSSNNWDSEKETVFQLEQNKLYQIPASVIVLEQWSDEATFYIFNDALYNPKSGEARFQYSDFTFPKWGRWPNPKQLVNRIHEDGLKLLLWQAPVMKYMEGVTHSQRDADAEYMIQHRLGVTDKDGNLYTIPSFEWFRGSYVPDFTNPATVQWWFEKRQYLFDELGIDGIKTDGGECIYGSELQFFDGRTGAQMRNEYPNSYIGAFHQFAITYASDGAITFSRAGYTGAQLTPMHWAGDERSTFEAFQASIRAGLNAGLSGIPFWGWDLGGFSGEIPTAELYIRGTQMATFCPVMQYHAESKGQFNMDRTPWNIAERTGEQKVLSIYKYYADLRMNLLPYIYDEAKRCSETGEPLMRAHILDYPSEEEAVRQEFQYMFGRSLLVAPVTAEGKTSLTVYLPEGNWLSLIDSNASPLCGKQYVEVEAQLESIPVFLRENSVVAVHLDEGLRLGSHVGNRWDKHDRLMYIVYCTTNVNYSYYDDQSQLNLSIHMTNQKLQMKYEWNSVCEGYICVKNAPNALAYAFNNIALREVYNEQELKAGTYMYRDNEILFVLTQGSGEVLGI